MEPSEMIDFILKHSPRLQDIAKTRGAEAARADLMSKPLSTIVDAYENLMHEVNVGHPWQMQAQAPTLPDNFDEIVKSWNQDNGKEIEGAA